MDEQAQVAHVGAGGTRHDRVAKALEQRECVAMAQLQRSIEAADGRARDRFAVCYGAGGWRVAVDAVGASAEQSDGFAFAAQRALQRELLVATAVTRLGGQLYGDLAAIEHRHGAVPMCAAQFAQTLSSSPISTLRVERGGRLEELRVDVARLMAPGAE